MKFKKIELNVRRFLTFNAAANPFKTTFNTAANP